jgi:RNA recognition motif-containing protein
LCCTIEFELLILLVAQRLMGDVNALSAGKDSKGKKRKKEENDDDDSKSLEIDINAPEPASKKALRKAKRAKANSVVDAEGLDSTDRKAPAEKEASRENEAPIRSPHGIWIGNLAFFVTKDDLQQFLTNDADNAIALDQISRIHLPQGLPKPGFRFQNKGFAHVDFQSAESVDKALRLSEKLVGGRRVLIKNSKDFQGRPEKTSKSLESKPPSTKRIFIGNLEFDISKEDLEHHFEICGPIHNVHMATFEDSGKCKGYAWVEFEQLSSAESAMRGWLENSKASKDVEGEELSSEAPTSKRTKNRIWVNKMGGRKLRMEYAEDKATRYKKRYGKESRSGLGRDKLDEADQSAVTGEDQGRKVADEDEAKAKVVSKKRLTAKQPQYIRSGYSVETMQKMTGAITEGQGTKVTFD